MHLRCDGEAETGEGGQMSKTVTHISRLCISNSTMAKINKINIY